MSYGINNNNNAPSGNYPGYSTPQHDPAPYKNNYAPQQQLPQPYQQQPYQAQVYQHQPYQQQPVYNPTSYGNNNYGNNSYNSNSFSNPIHAPATGPQAGRPPSSRSSCHSSSSSRSWGSQPPLTSSKRDQNWEKKRRLWLARKNSGSGSNFGESRPPTSTSTWSGGNVLDDAANPPSPLTKFMHQHAQQQQQQPPPSPTADFQRIGTASGNFPPPLSYSTPGQTAVATARQSSRGGLSTASSTSSSSGRRQHQPPGGHCQWSLG
ncbi:hypothetical protein PHYBOEH_000507 [Phytophthora boehmeriae]|uniref:Uncharacterized protein n=1 Tax=Phytophthora boehmeriae TaxID=109152 RepID=A0A8T1WXP0_9STRA|nr:hypothetical protein PHYBOEH_000507 [Phytophthora boehmeriae]